MPPAAQLVEGERRSPTEGLHQLPLGLLEPSPLQPRTIFDDEAVENLADAIRDQGLLQNLVARPHTIHDGFFEIVAGERRWRAMRLLQERGELPADHEVLVSVRDLDDHDLLVLGLAENMKRKSLHPLEEGEAFLRLVDGAERGSGVTARIAEELGVTRRFVQLRVQLARGLTTAAKRRFEAGELNIQQAKKFAGAPPERQDAVLEDLFGSVDDIDPEGKAPAAWEYDSALHRLTGTLPRIEHAHFDVALYTGRRYGEDDELAGDVDEFRRLQEEAIAATISDLEQRFSWVRRLDQKWVNEWKWPPDRTRDDRGAVVHVHPSTLKVNILLDRVPRGQDASGSEKQVRGPITQALAERARAQKSLALQEAVAADPLWAVRLAIVGLIGGRQLCAIAHHDDYHQPKIERDPENDATVQIRASLGFDHHSWLDDPEVAHALDGIAEWDERELLGKFARLVSQRVFSCAFHRHFGDKPAAIRLSEHLQVEHGLGRKGETVVDGAWLKGYSKKHLVDCAVDCGAWEEADRPLLEKASAKVLRAGILAHPPVQSGEWVPRELRFGAWEP